MSSKKSPRSNPSRRRFLRQSSAAVLSTSLAGSCAIPENRDEPTDPAAAAASGNAYPGGSDLLKVGLIGCGGRGTGAASNALRADPNVKLWAMGDAFSDMLEDHLKSLQNAADIAEKVDVPPERRFVGFDAYKKVIDECDVILIATSPHFRPLHVEYAVEKGKHLFIEKPVATDVVGLRRIQAACKLGAEKGLSMVSGLCYRYHFAKQETMKRVHGGEIGEIRTLQCTYNTGGLWHRGRKPEWSEMEYQMRNWLYFTWLSGDHIAEQHIHSLDKVLWAMKDEAPIKATSTGGRILRTDEKYGNAYDHFNTVFEWENGVRAFSSCRQMPGTAFDVSDFAVGTTGTASLQSHRITGENGKWRHRSDEPDDMYQNEHNELFKSIRAGKPIDNSDYMIKSTMLAIMGRMSAYTGQTVSWEQAWQSTLDLSPPSYEWLEQLETKPVALPGVEKFI